jgi:hypothetical protein
MAVRILDDNADAFKTVFLRISGVDDNVRIISAGKVVVFYASSLIRMRGTLRVDGILEAKVSPTKRPTAVNVGSLCKKS